MSHGLTRPRRHLVLLFDTGRAPGYDVHVARLIHPARCKRKGLMHPSNAEGHHSCPLGRNSSGARAKPVVRPPARPGWGPKCCGAGLILQAKPAILTHLGLHVLVSC